jgi:hypothetical protein
VWPALLVRDGENPAIQCNRRFGLGASENLASHSAHIAQEIPAITAHRKVSEQVQLLTIRKITVHVPAYDLLVAIHFILLS